MDIKVEIPDEYGEVLGYYESIVLRRPISDWLREIVIGNLNEVIKKEWESSRPTISEMIASMDWREIKEKREDELERRRAEYPW